MVSKKSWNLISKAALYLHTNLSYSKIVSGESKLVLLFVQRFSFSSICFTWLASALLLPEYKNNMTVATYYSINKLTLDLRRVVFLRSIDNSFSSVNWGRPLLVCPRHCFQRISLFSVSSGCRWAWPASPSFRWVIFELTLGRSPYRLWLLDQPPTLIRIVRKKDLNL